MYKCSPVHFTLFIGIIVGHLCENNAASNDQILTPLFDTSDIAAGEYFFRYVVPKQLARMETRFLDQDGNYVVKGTYGYIDDRGKPVIVNYVADSKGYRPSFQSDKMLVMKGVRGKPSAVIAALLG